MADTSLPELVPAQRSDGTTPSQQRLVEYYGSLGSWCNAAYDEGAALQQDVPELREMQTAFEYLQGMQWREQMPSYRVRPVSNELLAMFWETIGLLTDVKPMFQITDMGGDGGYSKIQTLLNKLAKGWAAQTGFERTLAFVTMFAMLTTAPAKLYWNPFARGDSGDPADGDISFEYLPATSLMRLGIDRDDDVQGDECTIYRRYRTLDWIRRAYPRMGKLVEAEDSKSKYTINSQAPVTVMPTLYQNLSPAAKRLMGGSDKTSTQSAYPRAEVREFWKKDDSINESPNRVRVGPAGAAWSYIVEPGKRLYPRGRLIIQANNVILYDEPNPYYHRMKPFALMGLYAVPWQQYALSVAAPWMKQQDILNQILGGVLQTVKKAINPPLIATKSAIHPEAMRAIDSSKPGLKITYSNNAANPPTWGQPPNLPGYVLQTYGTVLSSMKQSSGASAMDAASSKKQVPGGDTLDRISFGKNTPIRLMGRNIEGFTDQIGGMWVANVLQFYDAARRMELLGEQGLTKEDVDANPASLIPEDVNSEAFVRRWRFKCDKGTLLNVQRQDRIQIAFALRKGRDLSRERLLDIVELNIDREKNKEELAAEGQAMAGAVAAKGHAK
jgi:hypothetical protein